MVIESYSFGRMVVEGEEYRDDLIICGREVDSGWVRKRGHKLHPEDLTWITGKDPDLLVVGTGSNGRMRVTDETRTFLNDKGIDLWIGVTEEAADYFNARMEEGNEKGVAGAFHLTC
ncbi:MTH938/NDUFAF3 family protein [Candidatus Bipolaricaulota bacterium]|nr:MTH938/NDUFAF3 family protein [Candidatus Bipolaricaulota bacterium]